MSKRLWAASGHLQGCQLQQEGRATRQATFPQAPPLCASMAHSALHVVNVVHTIEILKSLAAAGVLQT
eukprot:3967754-Amphidinium_carterae.2